MEEHSEGSRPWVAMKATRAAQRCQITHADLKGTKGWSTRGQNTASQPKERTKWTFIFLPEKRLGNTVQQVSEIPVSDVVPRGETF